MTTLYLAWQDHQSRAWFPVGRLEANWHADPPKYGFAYIEGAHLATESANFRAIPGFPNLNQCYWSEELFPLFQNRVMNLRRPDRMEYLDQLGLDPENWEPMSELAVSGGRSHTDDFEVFPKIEPDAGGWFSYRCIIHGLRHTNPDSIRRANELVPDEQLVVSFELNNPATIHAIEVKTMDQYVLGWLPRYLIDCLHEDHAWRIEGVNAKVVRANTLAPLSHRILVEFSGKLPAGFSPMDGLPQYQPITDIQ